MGQHRQTVEEVRENLRELLDWQFAEQNDQAVAQALQGGQGADAVYGLDEAGLLDGFFVICGRKRQPGALADADDGRRTPSVGARAPSAGQSGPPQPDQPIGD